MTIPTTTSTKPTATKNADTLMASSRSVGRASRAPLSEPSSRRTRRTGPRLPTKKPITSMNDPTTVNPSEIERSSAVSKRTPSAAEMIVVDTPSTRKRMTRRRIAASSTLNRGRSRLGGRLRRDDFALASRDDVGVDGADLLDRHRPVLEREEAGRAVGCRNLGDPRLDDITHPLLKSRAAWVEAT